MPPLRGSVQFLCGPAPHGPGYRCSAPSALGSSRARDARRGMKSCGWTVLTALPVGLRLAHLRQHQAQTGPRNAVERTRHERGVASESRPSQKTEARRCGAPACVFRDRERGNQLRRGWATRPQPGTIKIAETRIQILWCFTIPPQARKPTRPMRDSLHAGLIRCSTRVVAWERYQRSEATTVSAVVSVMAIFRQQRG